MPALIVFDSAGDPVEGGSRRSSAQLRVTEEAEAVVKELGGSASGFAAFVPQNNPDAKVWINRDQVRMVRSA